MCGTAIKLATSVSETEDTPRWENLIVNTNCLQKLVILSFSSLINAEAVLQKSLSKRKKHTFVWD